MATGPIQVPLGTSPGTISSFVHDNDQNPTNVLEATAPFAMHVTFSIDPVLAAILGPARTGGSRCTPTSSAAASTPSSARRR